MHINDFKKSFCKIKTILHDIKYNERQYSQKKQLLSMAGDPVMSARLILLLENGQDCSCWHWRRLGGV